MTGRLTFGIDPGLTGAIATLLDGEPGPFLEMPTMMIADWEEVDGVKLSTWLRGIRSQHPGAYISACVEKVGAMPRDGGTSAFRFGESSGKAKAVLEALGIPYTRAIPTVWKGHFGLLKQDKDAARLLAIRRFPCMTEFLKRKKDIGLAEAQLIALWHENMQIGRNAA